MSDAARFPANFCFLIVPLPIAACDRIHRLEQMVWSAIYSQEMMRANARIPGEAHLSKPQIARSVGSDRSRVSKAISKLVEVGLVEDRGPVESNGREHGTRRLRTVWPDWLASEGEPFLRNRVDVRVSEEDVPPGNENVTGSHPRDRRSRPPVTGGHSPRDAASRPPVTGGHPINRVKEEEIRGGVEKDRTDLGALDETTSSVDFEEVDEPDLDSGSQAASETLEKQKTGRVAAREARVKKLAPPPAETDPLLREPSRRPELNAWRERTGRWTALDVVGYFACRYEEARGEEDPELFASLEWIRKRHGGNVSKYVKTWLGGDVSRARTRVDEILSSAEDRGMPVRLAYFFTPATEGSMVRLGEPVRRGKPTPAERNDRLGDYEKNKEYWDKKKADFLVRDAERRKLEGSG